jgi:peptidyl-prolyl cis-trans isomerase B (cyclophilin B)
MKPFASDEEFLKNAQRVGRGRVCGIYAAPVSHQSPARELRLSPTRALGCLVATAGTAVLVACGSSAGGSGSGTSGSTNASASSTSTPSGGCRQVAAPTPRGVQQIALPSLSLDPAKRYVVALTTNCGAIAIVLDVRQAPRTASSFAYLVKRGFYNDLTFHRVAAGFVIQGGDPNGDGSGGPGYTVVERPPADTRYTRGTVAMAKAGTDPAGASGSQFFIVTAAQAPLPAQYALVGKVVGSLAGVEAISRLPTTPPEDGEPIRPVVISKATLAEN